MELLKQQIAYLKFPRNTESGLKTGSTLVGIPGGSKYFLSLGPGFTLPNRYLPALNIKKSVEKVNYHLNPETKDLIRGKICNFLTNVRKKFKNCLKNSMS